MVKAFYALKKGKAQLCAAHTHALPARTCENYSSAGALQRWRADAHSRKRRKTTIRRWRHGMATVLMRWAPSLHECARAWLAVTYGVTALASSINGVAAALAYHGIAFRWHSAGAVHLGVAATLGMAALVCGARGAERRCVYSSGGTDSFVGAGLRLSDPRKTRCWTLSSPVIEYLSLISWATASRRWRHGASCVIANIV